MSLGSSGAVDHTRKILGNLACGGIISGSSPKTFLAPFMIHEAFPTLTETAFGSHPCRVASVTYLRTHRFHGGNTGSNPVGDANILRDYFALF